MPGDVLKPGMDWPGRTRGVTRLLLPLKRAWLIWDGPEALKLGEVPSLWPSLLPGRRALGGVRGCTGGSPGCT